MSKGRLLAVVSGLGVLLGACGNEVEIVTPSGSGSGGEGAGTSVVASASSGAPQPKVISITADATAEDLADGIVFQSRVDGSLVASWSALALPVTATVVDGDVVTFGWREHDGAGTVFHSRRVTPASTSIHEPWSSDYDPFAPTCALGPSTHVVVHVPPVPGAESARASGARSGHDVEWSLPADLELDVAVCAGEKLSILAAIKPPVGAGNSQLLASQFWQGIEPVPNGTIELEATLEGAPRKTLPVDITGIEPDSELWCTAHWTNSFAIAPVMVADEQFDTPIAGGPSFLFAPDVLDLPGGFPVAWCNGALEAPIGACGAAAFFSRFGRSDSPIPFDAGLAVPRFGAEGWSLGQGNLGDGVSVRFASGSVDWFFFEDPQFPPFPIVFPVLPTLPKALHAPPSEPQIQSIAHFREQGVATNTPDVSWTVQQHQTSYVCD